MEKPREKFVYAMTPMPPAEKPWYGKTRVCAFCNAQIMRRIEKADGTVVLRTQHRADCRGIREFDGGE